MDKIYKCQLPGYRIGHYIIADHLLAAINIEDSNDMIVLPVTQVIAGECVDMDELILILDGYKEQDPVAPMMIYSKKLLDTDELVDMLKLCPDTTIECSVGKVLKRTIAIQTDSSKRDVVYIMDMSNNYDRWETYEDIVADTTAPTEWVIEQVIR